jgi:hypothetical protein
MNDLPVTIPVVKLTSMTHNTPTVTMVVDTKDMPPPSDIQPCLPPSEPPPMDVVPGEDGEDDGGHPHDFPVGLIADDKDITCPSSPATPFEFPFDHTGVQDFDSVIATLPDLPSTMDSVTRVITTPRVCGLNGDAQSRVRTMSTGTGKRFTSMVDGGANICLTGTLSLLVDTISISPMPISVAVEGAGASMADYCTKRGLLPLQLTDGGVYFQPCYYCENAVETIISPQAILDASDTFVEWSQSGYKDDSPGTLRFYSDSGLASMTLTLTQ